MRSPARSISPAQHAQLLAALDDAIAYREHAAASGYATAYRMLRRQLAGPARPEPGAAPAPGLTLPVTRPGWSVSLSRADIAAALRAWHAPVRGRPVLPRVVLPSLAVQLQK